MPFSCSARLCLGTDERLQLAEELCFFQKKLSFAGIILLLDDGTSMFITH